MVEFFVLRGRFRFLPCLRGNVDGARSCHPEPKQNDAEAPVHCCVELSQEPRHSSKLVQGDPCGFFTVHSSELVSQIDLIWNAFGGTGAGYRKQQGKTLPEHSELQAVGCAQLTSMINRSAFRRP
jgi:hypothetical protein